MRLGKGLLALFAGGSGTGKTMAAEALASGQGVDLYKVDLSAISSKWIGETEKNLARIFSEAESSSGCGWLFFDEGESLFGSRGDIRQAQDRMLNMEVNYLLQRIEDFSGVVILATNLRQNIDEAFLRRIHALVEFPQPGPDCRAAIWRRLIPPAGERNFSDEELDRIAYQFELSGGNIRNVVLDARFRARAANENLSLRNLADGIAREYEKLGRPITSAEFGDRFYQWVVEDILDPPATGVSTR
jgi:SpoVK/Ycf46/Vps4 family AAA+-type ATPase